MSTEYVPGQGPPVYSGGESTHAAFDMLHPADNYYVEPPTDLDSLNQGVRVQIALEHENVDFHKRGTRPTFQMRPAAQGAPRGVLLYVASGFNSPPGPSAAALMPLLRQYGDVAIPYITNEAFDVDRYTQFIANIACITSWKQWATR
jgi:hypothetical protein